MTEEMDMKPVPCASANTAVYSMFISRGTDCTSFWLPTEKRSKPPPSVFSFLMAREISSLQKKEEVETPCEEKGSQRRREGRMLTPRFPGPFFLFSSPAAS